MLNKIRINTNAYLLWWRRPLLLSRVFLQLSRTNRNRVRKIYNILERSHWLTLQ